MTIINMKELDVKADSVARLICEQLSSLSVDYRVDTGGKTIGRKYSLNDEIGVPYGIVIDFDTFRYSPATGKLPIKNIYNNISNGRSSLS